MLSNWQKIFNLCEQQSFEVVAAPINDHWAIGLVDRLIQTIKCRLTCIKEAGKSQVNLKNLRISEIHQLRFCKKDNAKIIAFEAHFGRRPNTPLRTICTEQTLRKFYLGMSLICFVNWTQLDTVSWTQLIPDDKWDDSEKSDTEIELKKMNAIKNAQDRQISDTQGEPRLLKIEGRGKPTTRTGESVQFSLAKKIPAQKRSERDLQGLYEVLVPFNRRHRAPIFINN